MKFRELLAEHNIPIAPEGHEHTRDGWINFDCPWCSKGGHRWRLGYNIQYGYAACWKGSV